MYPPPQPPASSIFCVPRRIGTLVVAGKPTWIDRSHPKATVTSGFTLGVVRSVALDDGSHRYSVTQSSRAAL